MDVIIPVFCITIKLCTAEIGLSLTIIIPGGNYSFDTLLELRARNEHFTPTTEAFYAKIHPEPVNFPLIASAGVHFFQLDYISQLKVHLGKHLLLWVVRERLFL